MYKALQFSLALLGAWAAQAQDLDRVKEDVAVLCDSSYHGRGYVANGSNKAAAYLVQRFRETGIRPVYGDYYQSFDMVANTYFKPSLLEVEGMPLREGYDYIADPWSGVSSGRYRVQHFDSSHFQSENLPKLKKRRVPVVCMEGMDTPEEASALHSFKLSVIDRVPFIQKEPGKLTWGVGQRRYAHAVVQVIDSVFPENANRIHIDIAPEMRPYEAVNVVGMIPGERSDSCLVLTAHYDHLGRMGQALFPGASDNASGTAAMLDLASHFALHKPPFDLYIIAFAGEEAGLTGSKFFVENPLIPLDKIRFLINLDLLGSAAKGITIVNGTLHKPEISRLGEINKAEGYVPKIKLRGKAANSDHYWFSEAGVPAIFIYTEGNVTAYHDVYDVPEGLDWMHYEGVFNLVRTFIQTF